MYYTFGFLMIFIVLCTVKNKIKKGPILLTHAMLMSYFFPCRSIFPPFP